MDLSSASLWRERGTLPAETRHFVINQRRLEERPRGQIWTSTRPPRPPGGDQSEPKATGRRVTRTLCAEETHINILSVSLFFFSFSAGKKDFLSSKKKAFVTHHVSRASQFQTLYPVLLLLPDTRVRVPVVVTGCEC